MTTIARNGRLKYNLRDLLWMILVVGFSCAVWIERRSAADWQRKAGVWQVRAETLRQMVDSFEDPNHIEWTPQGATLVYVRQKTEPGGP